jgi:uncharacterized protein with PIN domain
MQFLLTKELGRLAKWLRILGFDAEYVKQDKISAIIIQALREGRIVITRNQRLSQRGGLKVILLRSEQLKGQLQELLKTLQMTPQEGIMFSRCTLCNRELKPIAKAEVQDKIPAYVFQTQQKFLSCPACQRVYWQGTHWGNVSQALKEISLL